MPEPSKTRCLLCNISYRVRVSSALYAEAFCSEGCEMLFASHVMDFYRSFFPDLGAAAQEKRSQLPQVEFGHTLPRPNSSESSHGQASAAKLVEWQAPTWSLMGNQQN